MRGRALGGAWVVVLSLVAGAPPAQPVPLQTVEVSIGDNFFEPQEIRVDVGDTVVWNGGGIRSHTVTSDDGLFDSGRMGTSDEFTFTFDEKGSFFYHCTLHGSSQRGMWGVVVVGEPKVDERPRLVVPDDYPTIQSAVDHAVAGTVIVVRPGTYREGVAVSVPRISIRGVDRFRTVLNGDDQLPVGIGVTANKVKIKNLTVRNYTDDGILFDHVSNFTVSNVDSIKNRRFGVRAIASYDGVFKDSFGYGSGTAAFDIESCFGCGAIVDDVRSHTNFTGLLAANTTGVTVRSSSFRNNGVGVLLTSLPELATEAGHGALLYGNTIASNNLSTVPPSGLSASYGLPYGTGVWIAGVGSSLVLENKLDDHSMFGVLISDNLTGGELPRNNRVVGNEIGGSGLFDIAWDGSGSDNCFDDNTLSGGTGPPGLQDTYGCSDRPFDGTPFESVARTVDAAVAVGPNRPWEEPPEPNRPRCQKSKPGCKR